MQTKPHGLINQAFNKMPLSNVLGAHDVVSQPAFNGLLLHVRYYPKSYLIVPRRAAARFEDPDAVVNFKR